MDTANEKNTKNHIDILLELDFYSADSLTYILARCDNTVGSKMISCTWKAFTSRLIDVVIIFAAWITKNVLNKSSTKLSDS